MHVIGEIKSSALLLLFLCCTVVASIGCQVSPQLVTTLENELGQLRENKALLEQSARDVQGASFGKRSVDQLGDNYEDLRDLYNRYLDTIDNNHAKRSREETEELTSQVQQAARTYFVRSGRLLGASEKETRDLTASNLLNIPQDLPTLLQQLPREDRRVLIRQLRSEVELPPWRRLK